MHFLGILDGSPLHLLIKEAKSRPIEGVRLYFASGHTDPYNMIQFWLKVLTVQPLPWLAPSEGHWRIDLLLLRAQFEREISKKASRPTRIDWPLWLKGSVSMKPDFEQPREDSPRLVFYLTETVLARQRNPAPDERVPGSIFIHQYVGSASQAIAEQIHVTSNSSLIGAIGSHAVAQGNSFTGNFLGATDDVDFPSLALELAKIRSELKKQANKVESVELDRAVTDVGAAQMAVENQDTESILRHLKAAGKWALDAATNIGTQVAVKAIQQALDK
ncbi:hypothetical protein D3C86_1268540 [compost metagenome]